MRWSNYEFLSDMNFLQGRPNWAFTAIDTIAMPSQANLLEINEPSGYEVGISNWGVKC